MELSITEENYLKAVYILSNEGTKAVHTNEIATHLVMKPASVTDMIKKLATKGLVKHEKYKGAFLTEEALRIALQIVRKHRLWETFLVEKLNFSWDQVHDLAEQLEHIQSKTLVQRLDQFLGHPKFDPHGDPIPDEFGNFHSNQQVLLANLEPQKSGRVIGVNDSSSAFLQYLNKLQISLGTTLTVVDKIEFDRSVEISIEDREASIIVSQEVASNIYLR